MHKVGLALKLSNTSFFLEIHFKSIHPWIWTVVCLLLGEGGQQFLFLMNCSVTLSSSVTDVFPEDLSSQVCVVTPTANSLDCLWSCKYDGVTSSAVCGNFLTGTDEPVTPTPFLQLLQQEELFPAQPASHRSLGTVCKCHCSAWNTLCRCWIWHHFCSSVVISAKGTWIWALLHGGQSWDCVGR